MPKKYNQLALHNSVCNEFYYRLQDCQAENNPITVIFGACDKAQKELDKCIKDNRQNMRARNKQLAEERHQKMKTEKSS